MTERQGKRRRASGRQLSARLAFAPAALLLLASCGPGPAFPYADLPDPRGSEYVIGVGDTLAIRVWHEPDFTTDIPVRPDGTITIPIIGDLTVTGLTPTHLREMIRKRLGAFVRDNPTITVAVTGANSYYVVVAGNVTSPGRFESKSYLTVSEAIVLAGGPTRFAAAGDTFVLRNKHDHSKLRIPVDYPRVLDGVSPEQDVVLLRGDQVVVP